MGTRIAAGEDTYPTRLLTVPNALSAARLAGVPVFLWLVLVAYADLWALVVLAASGASDWLDGKIARAWKQTSRLGQLLDPAADRLYIVAIVAGLTVRQIIPWWFAGVLVVRELVLGAGLLALYVRGYRPLQVHFLGKAATMCLLYAFPLLFLGSQQGVFADVAKVSGWGFAIWGTALYWCAAFLYVTQAYRVVTGGPATEARVGEDSDTGAEGRGAVDERGATDATDATDQRDPKDAPETKDERDSGRSRRSRRRRGREHEGRPA